MWSVAGGLGEGMLRVDEERVRGHVDEVVRTSVKETLNGLLDAEADRLCGAGRYERSSDRVDTRAGSYERKLQTKAGEVKLKDGVIDCRERLGGILKHYDRVAA